MQENVQSQSSYAPNRKLMINKSVVSAPMQVGTEAAPHPSIYSMASMIMPECSCCVEPPL